MTWTNKHGDKVIFNCNRQEYTAWKDGKYMATAYKFANIKCWLGRDYSLVV